MPSWTRSVGASLLLASSAAAQTWTSCNPMNVTCPDNPALGISNYTADFTKSLESSIWNHTNGVTKATVQGTEFTINKRFESPTIQTNFYIFFGSVEVIMKAAAGKGIISSIVIQSDDLDEIDWEWIGGNNTMTQSNYFGKGNQTTFDRAIYHQIADPMKDFHNYTTYWTSTEIQWIMDGVVLRTLPYGAANSGKNFPQTPSNLRLGIWAGGDPSNPKGTIEWSGGETDFTKAPFTMTVASVRVSDFGVGKAYHWSDKTGSFSSIQSLSGESTTATTIATGGTTTSDSSTSSSSASSISTSAIASTWASMSSTAKIGVYSGSAAGVAMLAALIGFCCIKKRRNGQALRAAEEARQEEQRRQDAEFAGMDKRAQDALPLASMTPQEYRSGGIEKSGTAYYARSIADSDVGSINKYHPGGVESRSMTADAPPVPTLYHNTGFGSRGYVPAPLASPTSPTIPNYNTEAFNFGDQAPSRGYDAVPHSQSPVLERSGQDFMGRSFSAAPSMGGVYQQPPQQYQQGGHGQSYY